MTSTLGKPGVELPDHLTTQQRRDCVCHPSFEAKADRIIDGRFNAALVIPENNPYWRHCSWEQGREPSILHALSHATKHCPDAVFSTVGQDGIDRKWLEHCSGTDARAWVRARSEQTGIPVATIMRRAGASFEVFRELVRRWGNAEGAGTVVGESSGEAG